MQRYIAFLRAVNVGGNTVKMETLRGCFEDLNFTNVQSFITSGNLIFETPSRDAAALEDLIESGLGEALGFGTAAFLRTTAELSAVAAFQPFAAETAGARTTLSVVFLKSLVSEELRESISQLNTDTDEFHTNGREVYWLCRTSVAVSRAGTLLGRTLARSGAPPGTMRNITTIRRLNTRYPAPT